MAVHGKFGQPCPTCGSPVQRVVYAATDPKTGACGSVFDLLEDPRHNHRVQVHGGLMAEEAGSRLTDYFRAKRR
jgi:tRNA(Arg) A34 adenosine deaminase TadA